MYHDLLLTLLGFPSDFITDAKNEEKQGQYQKQIPQPTYRVKEGYPHLIDSEREQMDKIVPLGWYYNQFQLYTDHNELSWGNVTKETQIYKLALSGAVKDLLHEYVDDVTGLEEALNSSELVPLSQFIQHLQKYLIVFPQLFAMLYHVEQSGLCGCQILDYFTKYACGVQVMSDMIDRIIARLRVPLLKQIFAWMVFGTLQDDASEFFIQKRSDHKSSEFGDMSLTKEQRLLMRLAEAQQASLKQASGFRSNDEGNAPPFDWYSTFSLRIENIPDSHVSPAIASKVMFAGKAAKLLQSSSLNNIGLSKEMKENDAFLYLSRGRDSYLDDSDQSPTRNESQKKQQPSLSTSSDLLEDMPYTREEIERFDEAFKHVFADRERAVEKLEKAIDLVCTSVSTRLWTLLKDHLGFYEYLHIIRNTYLMGKGEFMQCIVDDLHVLSQQATPNLEDLDDTLNWRVLRNAGKLVGLQDEDDIHRILQLKVQSHTLTVEKFHTDDDRFLSMAGVAQYIYPSSTSIPQEERRRYIYNPTGLLLSVPKAQNLAEHYAMLWREKHMLQLHQHGHHYRSAMDAEEFGDETGNPWRFSRHFRDKRHKHSSRAQAHGFSSSLIYEPEDHNRDAFLVRHLQSLVSNGDRNNGVIEGTDIDNPSPSLPEITLSYANAAVWFTDPKSVMKGFDVSVSFRPAWHVAKSVSGEHRVFRSATAHMTSLWPSFPSAYPFPRCEDIVLGSTSVCVHSDGRGISAVGQGELNRQIQHSLLVGVSFHACVFDTSAALDGEATGKTIPAKKTDKHPTAANHPTKSGVKYYARVFIARGGNDGALRLPLNKRLQMNIGDGYYRAPDPKSTVTSAEEYILAEKIIDLDKNLGYFPDNNIRSLSTLSSRLHLDVSYQRVMQYQPTTSSASVASSLAHATSQANNGDIFQGLRERSGLYNSAATAAVGSVRSSGHSVHLVGEVAHRMRVRIRPDEDFEEDDDHYYEDARYRSATDNAQQQKKQDAWDVDIPLDLSVFVKNTSGQAWVGAVNAGLLLQESSLRGTQHDKELYGSDKDSDSDGDSDRDSEDEHNRDTDQEGDNEDNAVAAALHRRQRKVFHTVLTRMHFEGKGSLFSYPVCSPFTSARYPDTFLQLEKEVSRIRAWMHLKLHVQFPSVFTVIFDADSKRHYERVFGLVMKVRLVARLLEKLWMARSKWMTDRLYCNLRHAMHFFISNLLYYLQVDVVDSEYATFQHELQHLTEFQSVLMAHRHFLANILRLSMLDNQAIQECFDRLLHLCLRFVAACRIQARSEAMYMDAPSAVAGKHGSGLGNESVLDETAAHLPPPTMAHHTPMLNRSKLSLSPSPATAAAAAGNTSDYVVPIYIPIEEFETIRKEFFQQMAFLLQFMKKVESRGFLFRLDFNGYISQYCMDINNHA